MIRLTIAIGLAPAVGALGEVQRARDGVNPSLRGRVLLAEDGPDTQALLLHILVCAACLAAGCDDYASKPIDRGTLLDQIARFLEKPAL